MDISKAGTSTGTFSQSALLITTNLDSWAFSRHRYHPLSSKAGNNTGEDSEPKCQGEEILQSDASIEMTHFLVLQPCAMYYSYITGEVPGNDEIFGRRVGLCIARLPFWIRCVIGCGQKVVD